MGRLVFLLFFLFGLVLHGQEAKEITWWNPVKDGESYVEGQGWTDEIAAPYDRLPKKAEALVRTEVWNLSKHSAGLSIRFISNASELTVRYGVTASHALNHMPATGVSGVDLYAVDSEGKQLWCRGARSFKDTITYRFKDLNPNDSFHKLGREYRLNLPLYNQVKWMEIGVP
ncbi:MAG: SGNH/GDSL hydrolase N-terminal domain-containing protein, partial [Flavobacteriaceae bacterium]